MNTVITVMMVSLLLVGVFLLGREFAPQSSAVTELVFRAYIIGCVENVGDINKANERCVKQAVKYQNDIKEILSQ